MTERRNMNQDPSLDHPLRLPRGVEESISTRLRKFAENASLELKSLYHDESLWIVSRRSDGLVNRIQVAAFDESPEPVLKFIPDAYRVDEDAGVRWTLAMVPRDLIQVISLRDAIKDPDAIEKAAWSAAKTWDSLRDEHLTERLPLE